jgi:hypothetical protein
MAVSCITWDERIVDALIPVLSDRRVLVPDEGYGLSDLFVKRPTVADKAALALERIGTPKALAAIASFDIVD